MPPSKAENVASNRGQPIIQGFLHQLAAVSGGMDSAQRRPVEPGRSSLGPGMSAVLPVARWDLPSLLFGTRVVSERVDAEPMQPVSVPVARLIEGGRPPRRPTPGFTGAGRVQTPIELTLWKEIAAAPHSLPVSESSVSIERPAMGSPEQRDALVQTQSLRESHGTPATARDLASALGRHPQGWVVLEQIAQVCNATPSNATDLTSCTDNAIARYDGTTVAAIQTTAAGFAMMANLPCRPQLSWTSDGASSNASPGGKLHRRLRYTGGLTKSWHHGYCGRSAATPVNG